MDPRISHLTFGTPDSSPFETLRDTNATELEREVEFIVNDCFFAVGQAIGMRKTVDYDAVVWWHDHFRNKFLSAMQRFGNRWATDRQNVTAVAFMLAERAVRYSAGSETITLEAAMRASADVQRHCETHARRSARRSGEDASRIAGYWCWGDGY